MFHVKHSAGAPSVPRRWRRLPHLLAELNIPLPEGALQQLIILGERLIELNPALNLTAIVEPDEICLRHFADSLLLLRVAELEGKVFLDAGTGAGFPGLPLAIARPSAKAILVDSRGKPIIFLREVIAELGLDNVTVLRARAEELSPKQTGPVDLITVRALGKLEKVLPALRALLAPGGEICLFRGPESAAVRAQEEKLLRAAGLRETRSVAVSCDRGRWQRRFLFAAPA